MVETRVYLAGMMSGLTIDEMKVWRRIATKKLSGYGFSVTDPVERLDNEQVNDLQSHAETGSKLVSSGNEIVDLNLYHISHCDIVLAELNQDGVSIGTIGGIIVASRELKKPVIAWGGNEYLINHPWVKKHITAHKLLLNDAIDYIRACYTCSRLERVRE